MVQAEDGIEKLKGKVDTLIVIPNQRILEVVDKKLSLLEAFRVADSVLTHGVQGISDLITEAGLINVDFADVKSVMSDAGSALMGMGEGFGENRAQIAARQATSSPLLEVSMDGARGVLFNIVGSSDLTMAEVDEASKIIHAAADPDANIIFGATIDETLHDKIRITVIATGFDEERKRLQQFVEKKEMVNPFTNVTPPPQNNPYQNDTMNTQNSNTSQQKEEEEEDIFDIPAFLRQRN